MNLQFSWDGVKEYVCIRPDGKLWRVFPGLETWTIHQKVGLLHTLENNITSVEIGDVQHGPRLTLFLIKKPSYNNMNMEHQIIINIKFYLHVQYHEQHNV